MTKPKLTPESLRSIFLDLQAANLDAVVVGGQAVNLWATQYCDRSPQLREFSPFASEDLDFYGGRIEQNVAAQSPSSAKQGGVSSDQ